MQSQQERIFDLHPKKGTSLKKLVTDDALSRLYVVVRNDNLDASKSQNTEPESNLGQNSLRTARTTSWKPNNPLLIYKVDSASKPPVQDAKNFPEVPTPDTGGLLGEIHKFLHESYSKVPQSPRGGTEPKKAPNTQIDKHKDLKSSHLEAASGKPPVPSATLPYETPNANLSKPKKPNQLTQRSSDPPASLPATCCLPGAPFGPVHFTEYPLKPEYKDYTADNILAWDPLARTTELTRYNQEGIWYVIISCLFRDKYNFLPAYQMDVEPPVTPKPMSASATKLPLDHTNKLFGILYIALTGVIDTIVPAAVLWLWVGKSMSYLIKLAPIL
ncbi:hypothetical protein DSO57_1011464 [Entomophthora muscae]|uniref:Uncharacterized protein n=1 Tax=Entomophthora muscae TaxID=34485 RepID=A0ACC2S812_9FUNG|nr:hypothetical protein DSO57_1011464 [Entomophthora muscae]